MAGIPYIEFYIKKLSKNKIEIRYNWRGKECVEIVSIKGKK